MHFCALIILDICVYRAMFNKEMRFHKMPEYNLKHHLCVDYNTFHNKAE